MTSRIRIPIRIKFMITFLVLVFVVIGVITVFSARHYQDDKKAYINDLTAMVAQGMAQEVEVKLTGYRERLELYARLVSDTALMHKEQASVSQTVFDEFPELISVMIFDGDERIAGVHNVAALETAGIGGEAAEQIVREELLHRARGLDGKLFAQARQVADGLPSFFVAFRQKTPLADEPVLVTAFLRSEPLQQTVSRFSAHIQYVADSSGNLLAHSQGAEFVAQTSQVELPEGARQLQNESVRLAKVDYEDDQGQGRLAAFARIDIADLVAGAEIPLSAANLQARQLVSRLLAIGAILLAAAIFIGVLFAHRITGPIENLSEATVAIGQGNFDVKLDVESKDEIGELAQSFNTMASELHRRDDELEAANVQLVQSEKMAAFGKFGAGIAHEVKNPLAGILACAQLAAEDVPEDSPLREDLRLIEKETRRCKDIIESLLKFARQEKVEKLATDVNHVLVDALAIVSHQLGINEVKVEQRLAENLPVIMGNANQLQQVIINLLLNAQQAMEGPGQIVISSSMKGSDQVEIRVEDNGPGIRDEHLDSLFEPFFTTKVAGKGTGLGLSVSFGIVQDHGGAISVDTELGRGTAFIITLPAAKDVPEQAAHAAQDPVTVA